jgi:serine/threonine protein phosphatase 1
MDYAVGDIHGCLDKVLRLLDILNYDPTEDRLLFLGDYIDRGPNSKGVIDLMLQLQQENPRNIFLMGNHEDNFLTYVQACIDGEQGNYWLSEPFFTGGGATTLQSYDPSLHQPTPPRLVEAIPPEHLQFMSQLPLYWQDDTYLLVHAGIRPGIPLERQYENDLLRIRRPFLLTPHGLDKCVIFGHTPFRNVLWEADKIGIDTGACFQVAGYGKLTALCLQSQQVFQSP